MRTLDITLDFLKGATRILRAEPMTDIEIDSTLDRDGAFQSIYGRGFGTVFKNLGSL